MPAKFAGSLDYEQRLAFHYLQRLGDLAKRYGNPEMASNIETVLTNAFNRYGR